MKETLLQHIVALLFGHKYYANVVNRRGDKEICLSCFIFCSKKEADEHARELNFNRSFMHVETVSFRSYKDYSPQTPEK